MKKVIIITAFALLTGYAFWSCEKDDICPEEIPTTPGVVIEFYEIGNRSLLKPVTRLSVRAENMNNSLRLNDQGDTIVSGVSTITIPLRTDADNVKYIFTLNTRNDAEDEGPDANSDFITFNYVRNEMYVSRACGYKTNYIINQADIEVPGVVIEADSTPWIGEADIINTNIENENEEHIRIYF